MPRPRPRWTSAGGSSCPAAGFRLAVGSGQDPAQRRSAAQVRGRAAAEPRTGVVIDLVKAAAPPTWLVSGRLLAALAAQRQDAFADVRPEPAATWSFVTLPMFYRDLSADELETSCRRAGQHTALHRVPGPCGA